MLLEAALIVEVLNRRVLSENLSEIDIQCVDTEYKFCLSYRTKPSVLYVMYFLI